MKGKSKAPCICRGHLCIHKLDAYVGKLLISAANPKSNRCVDTLAFVPVAVACGAQGTGANRSGQGSQGEGIPSGQALSLPAAKGTVSQRPASGWARACYRLAPGSSVPPGPATGRISGGSVGG